jgi:hypothetical protein
MSIKKDEKRSVAKEKGDKKDTSIEKKTEKSKDNKKDKSK